MNTNHQNVKGITNLLRLYAQIWKQERSNNYRFDWLIDAMEFQPRYVAKSKTRCEKKAYSKGAVMSSLRGLRK